MTNHHQRAMRQPRWATRAEAIAYGKVSATTLNDMMQQGVVVAATAANYAWGPFRASRKYVRGAKGLLGLKSVVGRWSGFGVELLRVDRTRFKKYQEWTSRDFMSD